MAAPLGTNGYPQPCQASADNQYVRMDCLHGALPALRMAFLVTFPNLVSMFVAHLHLGSQGE